jgi:hypothetical protein
VNGSTATTAWISPCGPGGVRFVIKSMHQVWNGRLALWWGCKCGGSLNLLRSRVVG